MTERDAHRWARILVSSSADVSASTDTFFMELHQIRYFLAVEAARNFSRAAEHCCITQPALTRAIQKLEEEVGGALFLRRQRGVELTELGRAMLPRLRRAYDDIADAQTEANELLATRKQRLRLGVMCTMGPERLIGFLQQMNGSIRNLEIVVSEAKGHDIVAQLLNDEIDVGIVAMPRYGVEIEAFPLYRERYSLTMPKGHRLDRPSGVTVADLDGEDYVERLNCEFDDYYGALHGEWPVTLNVRYSSAREDWVMAMIAAGMGVAIVPRSFLRPPGLVSVDLVEPVIERAMSLITIRDRPIAAVAAAFIKLVKAHDWSVNENCRQRTPTSGHGT
jgi:LysR family transcriptional regulator, hydrogen peroxide-inducible genes activator